MDIASQWVMVICAIGIGWYIGNWKSRQDGSSQAEDWQHYSKKLQYLFEACDAPALDSFAQDLDINAHTFQLHLAIANFFRRKGELEKATAIHQNLLMHPKAALFHQGRLTFELAQDYLAAGLYGRAEALFKSLAEDPELQSESVTKLLEIYEHEKDWAKARGHVLSIPGATSEFNVRLAHYCCELADQSIRCQDNDQAMQYLQEALQYDKNSVRASLQLVKIASDTNSGGIQLDFLNQVEQQDPAYVVEAIDLLSSRCLNNEDQQNYSNRLLALWQQQPSSKIMIRLASNLEREKGAKEAIAFLHDHLELYPSIEGVIALMETLKAFADPDSGRWITFILGVLISVQVKKPDYSCQKCGFSGHQLHWQCPRCRTWGSIKPILWS